MYINSFSCFNNWDIPTVNYLLISKLRDDLYFTCTGKYLIKVFVIEMFFTLFLFVINFKSISGM